MRNIGCLSVLFLIGAISMINGLKEELDVEFDLTEFHGSKSDLDDLLKKFPDIENVVIPKKTLKKNNQIKQAAADNFKPRSSAGGIIRKKIYSRSRCIKFVYILKLQKFVCRERKGL
nr:uncharacterized protein LOC121128300 [Lepeophtheirus salmonis]